MDRVKRSKRCLSGVLTLLVLATLLVGGATPVLANHPADSCLDVTPETDVNPTGSQHTVTATLRTRPASGTSCESGAPKNATSPVTVNFEITGPNDPDGSDSQNSPDQQCTIETGQSSCNTPGYTGLNAGIDLIRGFVADTAADSTEGRDETSTPGSTAEPDFTDVVEKRWVANTPTRLDCDDQSGDDRETNPSGAGSASNEIYTCRVADQFNNATGDPDSTNNDSTERVIVRGENETPTVNDPDNSVSYTTSDYECTPDTSGQCQITVTQLDGQTGTATICFFIDPDNDATVEGTTRCSDGSETTDEAENNNGSDQVEKTWATEIPGATTNTTLDCTPETDVNPTRSSHTITCVATNPSGALVGNANIDVEATGANDPDNSDSKTSPDFTCTTRGDQPTTPGSETGGCSFTHGPGGKGTTNNAGTTIYRAWIDLNGDSINEADNTEGVDENIAPGERGEPDNTDVVQKQWIADPNTIEMTPEADTATVGECNPFTITARDVENKPAPGQIIDVEQRHARADDTQTGNEPTVSFCTPTTGPNPSGVDSSRGDLNESPTDNKGTAGGETTQGTDSNGQITIGVFVTPGQGSDGSGDVIVTAFFDKDSNGDGAVEDNDDPDSGDPKDTSTKTWTAPAGPGGRSIDCEPETATTDVNESHVVTCTVRDAAGTPQSGVSVTFTEEGAGQLTSSGQRTTDSAGQAKATFDSEEAGAQTITGTITNSTQNEPDTDECNRAAGDPQNAQAGVCSDTVNNTWTGSPETECNDGVDNDGDGDTDLGDDGCTDGTDNSENTDVDEPQCSDGIDNDGDGFIDFPDDPSCSAASDDTEAPADTIIDVHTRSVEITNFVHFTIPDTIRTGLRVKGRVRVQDGYADCASQVGVKVQLRKDGRWVTKKTGFTDGSGFFKLQVRDKAGRYRVVAVKEDRTSQQNDNEIERCARAADSQRHPH